MMPEPKNGQTWTEYVKTGRSDEGCRFCAFWDNGFCNIWKDRVDRVWLPYCKDNEYLERC